jgi:hypothetical protein
VSRWLSKSVPSDENVELGATFLRRGSPVFGRNFFRGVFLRGHRSPAGQRLYLIGAESKIGEREASAWRA